MELTELIYANKHIKRRIFEHFVGNSCFFKDSNGRLVRVKPMGIPHAVRVPDVENPYPKRHPQSDKTPYSISLNVDSNHLIQGMLTEGEAAKILGVDYDCLGNPSPSDLHAMLEASTGGPGLANAYVLGGDHTFGEMRRPENGSLVIVPVQYYRISPRRHRTLQLE